MIALLFGLFLIALFVFFVMLFGGWPSRAKSWREDPFAIELQSSKIEIFRAMLRRAEIADRQQGTPADRSTGQPSE